MTNKEVHDSFLALLAAIGQLQSSKHRKFLASGSNFSRTGGATFYIYLPAAGTVQYITAGGEAQTELMIAGYHVTEMTSIVAGGTTTDLYLCYN